MLRSLITVENGLGSLHELIETVVAATDRKGGEERETNSRTLHGYSNKVIAFNIIYCMSVT